jgi:hypothetical protein
VQLLLYPARSLQKVLGLVQSSHRQLAQAPLARALVWHPWMQRVHPQQCSHTSSADGGCGAQQARMTAKQ